MFLGLSVIPASEWQIGGTRSVVIGSHVEVEPAFSETSMGRLSICIKDLSEGRGSISAGMGGRVGDCLCLDSFETMVSLCTCVVSEPH